MNIVDYTEIAQEGEMQHAITFYDKSGVLHVLEIHKKQYGMDFEANDERANEIYDWYIGTFQK